MFKVNPNREFDAVVKVYTPTPNGGHTQGQFKARFRQLSEKRIQELRDESDSHLLDEVLLSVSEVGDADGNELPGDEALELIKDDSCAAAAAVSHYIKATVGKNAQRKN